jgi:hypothetical protein
LFSLNIEPTRRNSRTKIARSGNKDLRFFVGRSSNASQNRPPQRTRHLILRRECHMSRAIIQPSQMIRKPPCQIARATHIPERQNPPNLSGILRQLSKSPDR